MEPHDPLDPIYPDQPIVPASENAWLTPAKLADGYTPVTAAGIPLYDLRPLTIGEILDRTFSVYRARFWLFAGIASLSGAVQLVLATGQMVMQHFRLPHRQFGRFNPQDIAVGMVANLLFVLAYSVTQATTAFAVSEVYLGRTTSIGESLRATLGRWYAYIGIAFWQVGSLLWLPLLLVLPGMLLIVLLRVAGAAWVGLGGVLIFLGCTGGMIGGYFFYLRNSLAVPATVVEGLTVRASMRRSKVLVPGAKARIFVVSLISFCLYMVVGVLQAPLAIMMVFALKKGHESIGAQAGTLLIGFLGHSVVTPVAMIGFTLVYFDQRVRKEAFDIAVLLGEEQAVAETPVAVEPAVVVETPAVEGSEGAAGDDIQI